MNQLVPVDQNRSTSLAPQNLHDALRLADMLAKSRLIPKEVQGSAADVFLIMEQARRWDIDFFALVQEVSFVRGRPMYSGKLTAAVVNARGGLTKRLAYDYKGKGDDRTITVSGTIQGEDLPRVVEVRLGDAKTSNEQWTKQPDQMLMYHGARVWARRHTPELMLGIYAEEEFDAPQNKPARQRDAVTGEVIQETGGTRHDGDGVVVEGGIPGFLDRRTSASHTADESAPSQDPAAPPPESGADDLGPDPKDAFIESCEKHIRNFDDPKKLSAWWNSAEQKRARDDYELTSEDRKELQGLVMQQRDALMANGGNGK